MISIWLLVRISDMASAGVAPSRSNLPHQLSKAAFPTMDGANDGRLRPLPQLESMYPSRCCKAASSGIQAAKWAKAVDFHRILTPVFHSILTPPLVE